MNVDGSHFAVFILHSSFFNRPSIPRSLVPPGHVRCWPPPSTKRTVPVPVFPPQPLLARETSSVRNSLFDIHDSLLRGYHRGLSPLAWSTTETVPVPVSALLFAWGGAIRTSEQKRDKTPYSLSNHFLAAHASPRFLLGACPRPPGWYNRRKMTVFSPGTYQNRQS